MRQWRVTFRVGPGTRIETVDGRDISWAHMSAVRRFKISTIAIISIIEIEDKS